MSDVEVIDLIKYAGENKPVDFTTALDAVLGQKALEALADRKQQIAASLFKDSDDTEETEEQESEENEDQVLDNMAIDAEAEDEDTEETGESDDQS